MTWTTESRDYIQNTHEIIIASQHKNADLSAMYIITYNIKAIRFAG